MTPEGPGGARVLVLGEQLAGVCADITFEMLACARELAASLGGEVVCALLGEQLQQVAGQVTGAHRVICLEAPALAEFVPEVYSSALVPLVRDLSPQIVLAGNTTVGMDLAGHLALALDAPIVASCRSIRAEGTTIVATSQLYGGKLLVESAAAKAPAIALLLPGSYRAPVGAVEPKPRVERIAPTGLPSAPRTRFERYVRPEVSDVDITKQQALVGVGRGMGQRENLPAAEGLAQALGAVLCGSRPVIDQGWLAKTRQVGRSGQTVKPKLYVALGISGAPEHTEGMKDSELIVAVNTDPGAPIFDIAHYGAVMDVSDLIPPLTERLRAARGG